MHLKTILNRRDRHQSFVYGHGHFIEHDGRDALAIPIQARANGRPLCSGCGQVRPGYDRLPERRFQHVPLWGLAVFFLYAPRRVECPQCGVRVEQLPWAEGKERLTTAYQWFLARWAKLLSWKQVATAFHTSWSTVYRAVQAAVAWGLGNRSLAGIKAIGVDEVQWQKGHHYLTLVYQIDSGCRRLLYIGAERTAQSLLGFFELLGKKRAKALRFVCSDMWKPYLKVIAKKAAQAVHVLDRFHIMVKLNKAIDEVRRGEVRQLKQDGHEPVLKHARWCLLKRPENLTDEQVVKLGTLLKYNLQSVRAWLQREDFQRFWKYHWPAAAARFLKEWCTRVMRSRLQPMQKVVRTLRRHEALILNWFRAKGTISAGMVEGFNYNVKLTMRKAYGFQTEEAIKVALYHRLGALPEPELAHRFC
jgi:transposase